MRSRRARWAAVVVGLVAPLLVPASHAGAASDRVPPHDRSTVLVSAADVERIAGRHGLHLGDPIPGTTFHRVTAKGRSADELLERLRRDPGVRDVELDTIRTASEVPNDPLFGQQMGAWSVGIPDVWDVAKAGPDVVVAVIDSGVDATHPDLAGRVALGYDFVGDDADPADEDGHGTGVAGVIAARANNGIGIAGISWDATVLPVRVLDATGEGTDSDVAAGITYAVDHGARILNLSLGGTSPSTMLEQAVASALARGAVIAAAAGNQASSTPDYPAAYPGVLAVAATDARTSGTDERASFSNFGPWVSMAAPGVNIYTTARGGGYAMRAGTSFSAPLVAGGAALLQAQHPEWSGAQIREALRSTAVRHRDPAPTDAIGSGVLDLRSAVATAFMGGPVSGAGGEPNDTFARSTPVGGTGGDVALETPGDVDVVRFDAGPSSWRTVTITPVSGAPKLEVEVFEADLDRAAVVIGTAGSVVSAVAPLGGTTYLRITNRRTAPAVVHWSVGPGGATEHRSSPWVVGATPKDLVVGDFVGSSRPDAVVLRDCSTVAADACRAELLAAFGVGGFTQDGLLGAPAVPTSMSSVATGDVDGDGRADVVIGADTGVLVHRGGDLRSTPQLLPTSKAVADVEVRDLDGDGRTDIAATTNPTGGVVLWQGAAGSWTTQEVPLPSPTELEVGDIDGDGRGDLVQIGCFGCPVLGLFRQTSSRTFVEERVTLDGASDVAVADATGDGRADVAVSTSTSLVVLAQAANGSLVAEPPITTASFPSAIAVGDADGDGRPDLAMTRGNGFGVLHRTAAGGYGPEEVVSTLRWLITGPERLAMADVDGDGAGDLLGVDSFPSLVVATTRPDTLGRPQLVASSLPDGAVDVAPGTPITFEAGWSLSTTMVHAGTVHVYEDTTSRLVPAAIVVNGTQVQIWPQSTAGHRYLIRFSGTQNLDFVMLRFRTVPAPPAPPAPPAVAPPPSSPSPAPSPAPSPRPARSGYWMVGRDGAVFTFGAAPWFGNVPPLPAGIQAVDLEPVPGGRNGYWVVTDSGHVYSFGVAGYHGALNGLLPAGERVTSLSATPSGQGYWLFTTKGRVVPFGDAPFLGDMFATRLNAPVLDSIPTPSGRGYYMVAGDGGIFTFGDAQFRGSMGSTRLNAPVESLVPDRDADGYWLVASDGGIFAFDAAFRGSMGDVRLNGPITGMVPFGDGYLMVGTDGGIFNFSDLDFFGSLGDRPPPSPIVSVAAFEAS